jgi:hypothetical protein
MNKITAVLIVFAIVAAGGLIWTFTILDSANAWHSKFDTKKDCVNAFSGNFGKKGANAICQKEIPH